MALSVIIYYYAFILFAFSLGNIVGVYHGFNVISILNNYMLPYMNQRIQQFYNFASQVYIQKVKPIISKKINQFQSHVGRKILLQKPSRIKSYFSNPKLNNLDKPNNHNPNKLKNLKMAKKMNDNKKETNQCHQNHCG